MIQYQLKLRMCKAQERQCEAWLYHLTSVWNWAVRKIELNSANNIYFSERTFHNLLSGHSVKLGIPAHVLQGVLSTAHTAWQRCFKKLGGKPPLKGQRNKLNSIPFIDPIRLYGNRASLLGLGRVRFHKMELPPGAIKCGRVVRRASGWYLCLFIDAPPQTIERRASGAIGIDPGFSHLLTTSEGEAIEHPREFEWLERRIGQAQRGGNRRLTARLRERVANQRKDRNHKLSRRLVAENAIIVFSKDNTAAIATKFGKSVASSGHAQLRSMLSYKSAYSGTEYIEVDSRNSTRTCSACGCLSGPTGLAGLSVRTWTCVDCGSSHDRDVNAAVNTFVAGAGLAHERYANA